VETFPETEYMPLSKGGRKLSTKIETIMKNNGAFSNIIVKYCEIFI